jgi:hypothetical protein
MDPERWGYRLPPNAVVDLTSVVGDERQAAEIVERAVRAFAVPPR